MELDSHTALQRCQPRSNLALMGMWIGVIVTWISLPHAVICIEKHHAKPWEMYRESYCAVKRIG